MEGEAAEEDGIQPGSSLAVPREFLFVRRKFVS